MNENLFDILVCTKCKGPLMKEDNYLICEACKLRYRIEDGIPNMILEYAESFDNRGDSCK